jgi:predicted TIM-barrel fold metal-dependent hydrolase
MRLQDMILISVDDHVIEPPNAFDRHMPAKYAARKPFVEQFRGVDHWNMDGKRFALSGLNAVAGRPRDEYGIEPCSFTQLRPGGFDVKARVDDMNVNGVLASMCFPSVMGFGGGLAQSLPDREYGLALLKAYNDWHVHDWAGAAPGRFIALGLVPMWDVSKAIEEVKRLSSMGVHAISIPENPAHSGELPSIHSEHWDPLWKACSDHGVVLCTHIGTGALPPWTTLDEPAAAWMTTIPMSTSFPAADWLFSPIWRKFPDLKLALSEAQIGWVPWLIERADFVYDHHRAWTKSDFHGELPSDVYRKHFIVCFIDDKYGVKNRHDVGLKQISWECDYPHSDCTWPDSPEILWESMKDVPKEEIDLMTHVNAMREFSFDPFKFLDRDSCSVGALRKLAAHVDTTPTRGLGGLKPGGGHGQVTVGQMQAEVAKQTSGALEPAA